MCFSNTRSSEVEHLPSRGGGRAVRIPPGVPGLCDWLDSGAQFSTKGVVHPPVSSGAYVGALLRPARGAEPRDQAPVAQGQSDSGKHAEGRRFASSRAFQRRRI